MQNIPETVDTPQERPWVATRYATLRTILIVMIPHAMVVLNMSMIRVALPAIRSELNVRPELVAWVVTGYTLPFVISMPFYGRLGDELGKRRLFLIGIVVFFIGTIISYLAANIYQLFLGRAIQGVGAGGFVPLAMATIAQIFPDGRQGQALATWNSSGPLMSIAGPVLGGFLIQGYAWQIIFLPILVAGVIAPFVLRSRLPDIPVTPAQRSGTAFDWVGGLLLAGSFASLILFVSSESFSGVANLHDWRFLGLAVQLMVVFILWERRCEHPLVDFQLFSHRGFAAASLAAGVRMIAMSSVGFILPLYLTDVFGVQAASIGLLLLVSSAALLVSMQIGGRLADRLGSWIPVAVGFFGQALALGFLALLSPRSDLLYPVVAMIVNGLAAGLTLAPLHRAALRHIPAAETSAAAGLYSMIRFSGTIFGPPIVAFLLGLSVRPEVGTAEAYAKAFGFVCAVALFGLTLMLTLRAVGGRKS